MLCSTLLPHAVMLAVQHFKGIKRFALLTYLWCLCTDATSLHTSMMRLTRALVKRAKHAAARSSMEAFLANTACQHTHLCSAGVVGAFDTFRMHAAHRVCACNEVPEGAMLALCWIRQEMQHFDTTQQRLHSKTSVRKQQSIHISRRYFMRCVMVTCHFQDYRACLSPHP